MLDNPEMLTDLLDGLNVGEDLVRGRAAHALEKIARVEPEWLQEYFQVLLSAGEDPVAMVRLHMAMIYADLALFEERVEALVGALEGMLDDPSVFVRSWVISSLCIIAKLYPRRSSEIIGWISAHSQDESTAIRARVRKALNALVALGNPLPSGWLKSERIRFDANP